jgi:hypothetical protein
VVGDSENKLRASSEDASVEEEEKSMAEDATEDLGV